MDDHQRRPHRRRHRAVRVRRQPDDWLLAGNDFAGRRRPRRAFLLLPAACRVAESRRGSGRRSDRWSGTGRERNNRVKLSSQRATRHVALASLLSCVALVALAAAVSQAQTRKDGPAERTSAHTQSGGGVAAQTQPQPALTPRERRAQAYAKLLEGQRYFENVRRRTLTEDALPRAQSALHP